MGNMIILPDVSCERILPMKKIIFTALCLCLIFLLFGCHDDSPQQVYPLDTSVHICDGLDVLLTNDSANERFVYSVRVSQPLNNPYLFSFAFSVFEKQMEYSSVPTPSAKSLNGQFVLTDSAGSPIVFDASGYCSISASTDIFISYKNAPEDTKAEIQNKPTASSAGYTVRISDTTFRGN